MTGRMEGDTRMLISLSAGRHACGRTRQSHERLRNRFSRIPNGSQLLISFPILPSRVAEGDRASNLELNPFSGADLYASDRVAAVDTVSSLARSIVGESKKRLQ